MLSNTATPIYYGKFRDRVIAGKIPVCQTIELQMQRIDRLIADPRYYYDDKAINGFIAYVEGELTLTDGADVQMLDEFKIWAEDLLSWFYFEENEVYVPDDNGGHYEIKVQKRRLRNKQYLIIPRGAAKTMYLSFLQAHFLVVDGSTTHQVTTAPTMKQADECLSPIRTAISRARGPVFKMMTEGSLQNTTGSKANRVKLASTKNGIENFMTGSLLEIRPMSINKLQGLRCKVATVDEWLSGDINEDVIGAIEQGASKIPDWVIVAASSEGTVRNGPGDSMKLELMSILRNEYEDDHTSIWYYKLDNVDEVSKPELWIKANPCLGKTVTYETYHRDVKRAEKAPANRNDILAKRFNIPMEGSTYFFTYDETIPHQKQNYDGMACSMGADLSLGDDFCAFTFLFPLSEYAFGVKSRCYISELTYKKLSSAMRIKYDEFMREETLVVMPGSVLDIDLVYDDIDEYITEHGYDVRSFGYDPYNAPRFVTRWCTENGPFGVEKVLQGMKTESVPLGEIKKLAEDRNLVFDQSLLSFCIGNAVVLEDTNGNRKLLKRRHSEKIDAVAALVDALVAFKIYRDSY